MNVQQKISVEVAYALPDNQVIISLTVVAGTTAFEAVRESGITERFKDINLDNARLGVFSKPVTWGEVLREGDRVQIYRPLIADPKAVRKARTAGADRGRS